MDYLGSNPSLYQYNMQRLAELQGPGGMIDSTNSAIQDARNVARKPPWLQKAFVPTEVVDGTIRPTMYLNDYKNIPQLQRQMSSLLGEQEIARVAAALHAPHPPVVPPPEGSNMVKLLRAFGGTSGAILPSLLQPSPLNTNEAEELKKRYPETPSQAPTYRNPWSLF